MQEITIILVCLFLNAILAGLEMAFVTVSRPTLRNLAKDGSRDARRVLRLRENPERTLSVIQVGITLVGVLAAVVGGISAEARVTPWANENLGLSRLWAEIFAIVFVVIPYTFTSVVLCELVPKTLALRRPLDFVLKGASWILLFDRLLAPVVRALELSTKLVLKTFFPKSKSPIEAVEVPKEVMGEDSDTVELDELSTEVRQYVLNLVNIEQKRVRDVYLPWDRVSYARLEQTAGEVEATIISSGHTRLPVLKENEVIGLINSKEFMSLVKFGHTDWHQAIRPMVKVRGIDPLLKVLRKMQESRSHLATVYSKEKRLGIVTMEDILEEIIGDVFDEDDDGAIKRVLSTASTFRALGPRVK